MEDKLLSLKE